MDTGAAIIIIVIIALVAFPFILKYLFKKAKSSKFLKEFKNQAEKEKLTVSQKEFWNNSYIIGIDDLSKKLLYTKKQNGGGEVTLIDLEEIEKCKIVNVNKTLKNQYSKNYVTDRLVLVFSFLNEPKSEKVLEFYDSTEFMPSEEDISRIQRWSDIINSNLRKSKQ